MGIQNTGRSPFLTRSQIRQVSYNGLVEPADKEAEAREIAHEREQAREWWKAVWILTSAIVLTAILAVVLMLFLERR